MAVLFFKAGVLSVGSNPAPAGDTRNILYCIIAFIVGYRKQTFRELMKRVTDIVLTLASSPVSPTVTGMTPAQGPAAGGTLVMITGTAFTGVTSVKFGGASVIPVVDSDGLLKATTPAGVAGPVPILVVGKSGTAKAGEFTYQ